MSRIKACFDRLKQNNRTALIPYIMAGDPQPAVTVPLMHAMVQAGADLIELGVPFSDPMADGPVIQLASERALEHHIGLHHVIDMVRSFRQQDSDTPVILMGYLNPVEVMGYETFASTAGEAGVDGALTVDIPPEESHDLIEAFRSTLEETAEADVLLHVIDASDPERLAYIEQVNQVLEQIGANVEGLSLALSYYLEIVRQNQSSQLFQEAIDCLQVRQPVGSFQQVGKNIIFCIDKIRIFF